MPATDAHEGFLGALLAFCNSLAKRDIPAEVVPWLAGAPLIPLRKKRDGGFRPIAIADTIRCVIDSLCMARFLSPLKTF